MKILNRNMMLSLCFFVLLQLSEIRTQETTRKTPSKVCSGYGYQVWLSCITDPCIFASCPAFGKLAECRKEISEDCRTCRAAFFLNGRRVNCQLRNFECPPGLELQQCASDPCSSTECRDPRFAGAQCRGYYCGGCLAQYFVDGQWQQCPSPDVKLQGDAPLLLPEIERAMREFPSAARRGEGGSSTSSLIHTCPDGTPEPECPDDVCTRATCPQFSLATCVINKCQGCKAEFYFRGQLVDCQSTKCGANTLEMSCPDDPCRYATCPLYPGAECRPSNCGFCHPEWFVNNREVNCFSRMPDDYQCPNGLEQKVCPKNTCRFKRCLKRKDAFCRINNCGGCYAEYVTINNEIVDCVGWWTLYEQKKPLQLTQVDNPSAANNMNERVNSTSVSDPRGDQSTRANMEAKSISRQKEIDALFGDLGLVLPSNSEIVSSSMQTSKDNSNSWNFITDNMQNTADVQQSNPTNVVGSSKPLINQNFLSLNSGLRQDNIPINKLNQNELNTGANDPTMRQQDKIQPDIKDIKQKKDTQQIQSKVQNRQPLNTNIKSILDVENSNNQQQIGQSATQQQNGQMATQKQIGESVIQQEEGQSATKKQTNWSNTQQNTGSSTIQQGVKQGEHSPILFKSLSIPVDSRHFRPGIPIGGWNR